MMRRCLLHIFFCVAAAAQYNQPYRPRVHFSPLKNWTNDPNGLVYFEGEYHLFFQFNPFGDTWGHMSWGHAVSTDLVHWRELPVAIPEENGIMIFTGSTVVDERNTSGFCQHGKPCMVAVYTGHTPKTAAKPALQTQNLAYSNDRGRTWTKYRQNPVLNLNMPDFRDPHVFWSPDGKGWVMAVALPDSHKIRFYRSPDLKQWKQTGEFGPAGAAGGQWECPSLFPLPLDGRRDNLRWVLKVGLNPGGLQGGSGEQYFVGTFDGATFINANPSTLTLWTDYGKDCYCALAFQNMPPAAPPTLLGWMSNWQYANQVPTTPWRGQMTVPREIALKTFPEGIRLTQQPVVALSSLREKHVAWKPNSGDLLASHTFLAEFSLPLAGVSDAGLKVSQPGGHYTLIGYDAARHEIYVDRTHSANATFSPKFPARTSAPFPGASPFFRGKIVVDCGSLEVFSADGRVAITNLIFPTPGPYTLETYATGTRTGPISLDIWTLRSIW